LKSSLAKRLSVVIITFIITVAVSSESPAFPSAVGFGIDTPAGRGGRIIKVVNLNPEGEGSLKAALETQGPRIVVFEIGGVIDLDKKTLRISEPYITVAGQTAPSPGITMIRGSLEITAHDVLIQHIRLRIGDAGMPKGSGYEPEMTVSAAHHVVIDHCSVSWGVDENLSISGPRYDGPEATSHDVTISNCFITEGLSSSTHSKGIHSMGTLVHDNCTQVAIIGNFYAHNDERNPWFKGGTTGIIVNNVIYNPGKWAIRLGLVSGEWYQKTFPAFPKVSVVGNVLKFGVNTPPRQILVSGNEWGEAYCLDNLVLGRPDNAQVITGPMMKPLASAPLWPQGLVAMPVKAVIDHVMYHSGARPRNRDKTDIRLVTDFFAGSGKIIDSQNDVGGYPMEAPKYRALSIPQTGVDEWLAELARELE